MNLHELHKLEGHDHRTTVDALTDDILSARRKPPTAVAANGLANGWAAFALTAFPTGKPRTAQYVRDGPRFLVGLGATDNLLPVETLSNQIASSRISQ